MATLRLGLAELRRATGLEVPEAEDEGFNPTPSDEEELLLKEKREKVRKRMRTILEPVPSRSSVKKGINFKDFLGATPQKNSELEVHVYKLHIS